MKRNFEKLNRYGLLALVTTIFIGAAFYPAQAALKLKKSDKLSKKMSQVNLDDYIDVIIKPASGWTNSLSSDLSGRAAVKKRSYTNFAFQVYRVKKKDIDAISSRTDVDFLTTDDTVKTLGHLTETTGAASVRSLLGTSNLLHGTGVGIVIVDSGLDSRHTSFLDASGNSRIVFNEDFTGENLRTEDPYGHGTHVASIAAGNGMVSNGAFEGVAPNARLINLRVLNGSGTGTISNILAALDWIYTNRANTTYNMKVVNLSLGSDAVDSYSLDPICIAVRKLVDSGIVVAAAAGNDGKDGSGAKIYGQIHTPGIEPSAITVGAVNSFGTSQRSDDSPATYSSRGPTRSYYTDTTGVKHFDNLIKPDLVAPGNKIVDAQAYNGTVNYLVANNPALNANVSESVTKNQMYLSGTSMATPAVAGAAALLLQANPKLTPNMVKMLLMYTAQPLNGFNQFEQGAGELNIDGAVRLGNIVRRDLTNSTPLNTPLLTAAPPAPQSTVGGETFAWGQGIIMDYTFATGTDLITNFQKIYGIGYTFGDGTVVANGALSGDGVFLGDGVLLSDNVLTANGVLLGDGYQFLSCGVLLGDGVLLSDGVLLADGVLLSDGVLLADSVAANSIASQASKVLVNGDITASMQPVVDNSPNASPTALTASAASKNQINLTWSDASSNETGFSIERCAGSTCTNFVEAARVGANVKTFSNTGLVGGTTYRFRVRAYNDGGVSFFTNIAAATIVARQAV